MKTPSPELRIGIIGGGQLGLMLAEATARLGFKTAVLDPAPASPASAVADRHLVGQVTDPGAIHALASQVDVLTFEIESAHEAALEEIAAERPDDVHPFPATLTLIKDKLRQKEFLLAHGFPVASFTGVSNEDDVEGAALRFGYPLVLKARFGGYDGRGNATIKSRNDIPAAMHKLAGSPLYAEGFVEYAKELAVVAARSRRGEIATYPVVETIHQNHICHTVIAPAPIDGDALAAAEALGRSVLAELRGVGVFAVELFYTKDGRCVVNEIAPRVHNSGHFTIEACATSQFEQHIRAIAGLPLGDTGMTAPAAVMVNILGDRSGPAQPRGIAEAQALPGVAVHIYGKMECRPERKMGHLTATAGTLTEALHLAQTARKLITI